MFEDERAEVAAAARRIATEGLVVGSAGNVARRVGDRLLVTATGSRLAEIVAGDVAVVALDDGRRLDGPAPSSELPLHLRAFRELPIVGLVHTHAKFATALGCVLTGELPLVHYGMLALGGSVRIAPYRQFGTDALATVTVEALRGRDAALMASHGAVSTGADLSEAVDRALLLEWACDVYWHARALGTPRILSGDELLAAREAMTGRAP